MTYEKLKAILQQRADDRKQETAKKGEKAGPGVISGTELMLAGAIAKAGAILATYPHEVVYTYERASYQWCVQVQRLCTNTQCHR